MLDNLLNNDSPVVWVLFSLSLLSVSIILFKLLHFWIVRSPRERDFSAAVRQMQAGEAGLPSSLLGRIRNPRSAIYRYAAEQLPQPQSREQWQQNLSNVARTGLDDLGSYLRALEVIAMIAPLLGLLGTVLGMIEAFQAMEQAGSRVDPSVLSGGIWQALLTTAIGLIIAIPVSVAHAWFERRVEITEQKLQADLVSLSSLRAQLVDAQTPHTARNMAYTSAA